MVGDKYLVYSTNSGKVECIERETGRSAWIYSCSRSSKNTWQNETSFFRPRLSIANWWERAPWIRRTEVFYESEKKMLDADLSIRNMLGVSAAGEEPAHLPVTFDPNPPSMDFPGIHRAALACTVLPYTAFVALWLTLSRRLEPRRRIVILVILLVLNAWAFYSYGRYSEAAFSNLSSAMLLSCAGLAVNLLRLVWRKGPPAGDGFGIGPAGGFAFGSMDPYHPEKGPPPCRRRKRTEETASAS